MSSDDPAEKEIKNEKEFDDDSKQTEGDADQDSDEEIENAIKKFEDQADLGDSFYFYQSWSAWSVVPTRKTIAPIARIVVGDQQGNVVFNRPVVLTGVADLMNELAGTLIGEVVKASEMQGFSLHLPTDSSTLIENLKGVIARTSRAVEILEDIEYFNEGTTADRAKTQQP